MGTINSSDRMAATLYCLGTWFVSGIYLKIPCIKETVMMMIIIIIVIIIIIMSLSFLFIKVLELSKIEDY
jgi:hypothetical protein